MPQGYLNRLILKLVLTGVFISLNLNAYAFYYQVDAVSPSILVFQDSADESSMEISEQLLGIFRYTEFDHDLYDFTKTDNFEIPTGTQLIINTAESIIGLTESEIEELIRFVATGGKMLFVGVITDEKLAFLQGIKSESDFTTEANVRGIKGLKDIFPGFKDRSFYSPTSVPHDGLKAENFSSKVQIYAVASTNEAYPVLLENRIGKGSILIFNTSILYEKQYRGLIFSGILKLLPNLPYRVANAGTMFLDDFPSPLYNTKLEPIDTEYGIEQAEFVYDIWWPEMKEYADSVFMTYSAMTAFNYNANIVPPFDYNEWELARLRRRGREIKPSIELAKDILKTRHELALHGYNHFSLTNDEWDYQKEFMMSSLKSVQKRWRIDDLGKLPVTYVPPTNYIDSTGIQALVKGMPSIKIMSSLYLGEVVDGGGREFGVDPYNSKLFDYPRITSGFTMRENSLFDQHGMQLLTGVWSHFVHPDDVFQIVQRDADAFESRNPDELGWRTTEGDPRSLFGEFKKRINYTREQYPFLRLVSADYGAKIVEDWLETSTKYYENQKNYLVQVIPPRTYVSTVPNKGEKHWFMYVQNSDKKVIENFLSENADGFSFSKFWDGYLYQFYSNENILVIPKPVYQSIDGLSVDQLLANSLNDLREFNNVDEDFSEPEITPEQQLKNAINSYLRNPKSMALQEQLITLSLENDQTIRAIQVLEFRLKSNPNWVENDITRLITYYGYESAFERAENYLEELWRKYGDEKVIQLKNRVAEQLGLYSPAFLKRWRLREINVLGESTEAVLAYTSLIESEETWPEVKQRLLGLIENNPESDSLYAYTIQRSFYYEPSDSTIALLEGFPDFSHDQLNSFSTQFANIYGYEIFNFTEALYWAERSDDISNRAKLEWIAQNNDLDQFYDVARQYLNQPQKDDSLRAFAGTTLYYQGQKDRGYEIMYPLFNDGRTTNNDANQLITEEFKFITYNDRKDLYKEYPNFFDQEESERLKDELRWNEGVRLSLDGEYFSDNFDNSSARGGASIQFGNRRNLTHLFKLEDIYVNNRVGTQNFYSNFSGLGYEYERRKEDYSRVFKFGPSVFFGDEGLLAEAFISYSISYDSTFTSLNLSFEPEYTREAILQDIYKVKGEFYREDPWFNNNFLTTLSGNGQFYTNEVFDYSVTGRAYLQPWETPFRGRLIGELAWQDATKSFVNADPFFTQNNYFLKGVGLDLRYRNPNDFNYDTLFELEVMGKHASTDGYFMTGRVNIEHKFKNFWQVKVGSELSTSSVYQSNRIFLTISHFFRYRLRD